MLTIDCNIGRERQRFLEKQKLEDLAIEAAFIAVLKKAETVSSDVARMLGEK